MLEQNFRVLDFAQKNHTLDYVWTCVSVFGKKIDEKSSTGHNSSLLEPICKIGKILERSRYTNFRKNKKKQFWD
jgi:hypothetical protein